MLIGCGCNCPDIPPVGSSESGVSASVSFSASEPPERQVTCNVCVGGIAPLTWDVSFNYGGQHNPAFGKTAADFPCLPEYANRVKPYRCVSIGQCGGNTTPGSPETPPLCRWRSPDKSKSIRLNGSTILGCMDEPIDVRNNGTQWHRVYILMGPPGAMAQNLANGCMPTSGPFFFGGVPRGEIAVIVRYGGNYDERNGSMWGGGLAMYETQPGTVFNCLGTLTLHPVQFQQFFPWGSNNGQGPAGYGAGGSDPNLPATVTLKPGPA